MPATEKNARKKLKKNGRNRLKLTLTFFLAFLVFVSDFLIKTCLRLNFAHQSFPLIENLVSITVVFNTGTAFGLLQGKTNFLIYFSLILIFVFFLIFRMEKNKSPAFLSASGLILGGAASNLIDRIMLGAVVDYIDLGFWPVFNLSDACITTGACLLIIHSFKKQKKA